MYVIYSNVDMQEHFTTVVCNLITQCHGNQNPAFSNQFPSLKEVQNWVRFYCN